MTDPEVGVQYFSKNVTQIRLKLDKDYTNGWVDISKADFVQKVLSELNSYSQKMATSSTQMDSSHLRSKLTIICKTGRFNITT